MGDQLRPRPDRMLKLVFTILIFTATLEPAAGQNNVKTLRQLRKLIALLTPLVQQAQNLVDIIQKTTTTPAAGTAANNVIVIADYYLGSGIEKCGPQTILGWTENADYYRDTAGTVSDTNTFTGTTGIFVPPVGGYYKICAYSRFKNTGNSVDMCIRKGTTQIACYVTPSRTTGGRQESAPSKPSPPRTRSLSTWSLGGP